MKIEFDFTQSEYTDLTSNKVSDEDKLAIFKRKFDAITKTKTVVDLLNELRVRFMDYCDYIAKETNDVDVDSFMEAYKKEFYKVVDELNFYLDEIVEKGIDDTRCLVVKSDLFTIQNRVHRAYDKAEEKFCNKGLAFVDLNEKRIGIDNCIDKIVSEFIICFDSDEDILRDNTY